MEPFIETQEQLEKLIQKWGFVPFFKNGIEGFSIEEAMPRDLLFGEHGAPTENGAWQWKGPIISHWEAAYGKFFAGKAGFVSLKWLPDLMNWRRKKYPLSKMDLSAKHILNVLRQNESMLSKQLKTASGFSLTRKKMVFNSEDPSMPIMVKNNSTSFDVLIAGLQMATYVCIADFEYSVSKQGELYGFGVARYCTPEAMYELDCKKQTEGRTPLQSHKRIIAHLKQILPHADEKKLERLI